jgi:diamine N-acetyltransferase
VSERRDARPLRIVELAPVTRINWREAISLRVRPDQEPFTPSVAVSLAKVGIRPDGPDDEHRPYAVLADGAMVGFGELSGSFGSWETLWFGGFLIDARFQGRGLGAAALEAFVELARRVPACLELGLTVVPENEVGRRLYRAHGFRETGERFEGELIHRRRLEPGVER